MGSHVWQILSLVGIAVAAIAGVADHRRMKRNDFDRVGFMPWTTVQMFALFGAAIAGFIALKQLTGFG